MNSLILYEPELPEIKTQKKLETSILLSFYIEVPIVGYQLKINTNYIQQWIPLEMHYDIYVKLFKNGKLITLILPSLGFELPKESFITTYKNIIPVEFRPYAATPFSFTINAHVTDNFPYNQYNLVNAYSCEIWRNGQIRISLLNGHAIPAGQFVSMQTSITYLSEPYFPVIDNFIFATWGSSNSQLNKYNDSKYNFDEYLDYQGLSFQDGKIYTFWTDNATIKPYGNYGPIMSLAFTKFEYKNNKLKQTIKPYYIDKRNYLSIGDTQSAVNRNNANYIASISSTSNFKHVNNESLQALNYYTISTDGGKTFKTSFLSYLPPFNYNNAIKWDRFNNLWIMYLTTKTSTENYFRMVVAASPYGDPDKFKLIDYIEPLQNYPYGYDWPLMDIGQDYENPDYDVVWCFGIPLNELASEFFTVAGNNSPGYFKAYRVKGLVNEDDAVESPITYLVDQLKIGGYGWLSVGTKGDVMFVSQTAINSSLYSSLEGRTINFCIYNPKGLKGQFGTRNNVSFNTTGAASGTNFSEIEQYRVNTVGPIVVCDKSNSKFRGRFYVAYIDQINEEIHKIEKHPLSIQRFFYPLKNFAVYLTWSDNNGLTWHNPVMVSNSIKNPIGVVDIAIDIDQSTGNLILGWYDGRKNSKIKNFDTDYPDATWTGALITVEMLEKFE